MSRAKQERERLLVAEWLQREPDPTLGGINENSRTRLEYFAALVCLGLTRRDGQRLLPKEFWSHEKIGETLQTVWSVMAPERGGMVEPEELKSDVELWRYYRVLIDVADMAGWLQFARVDDKYQLAANHILESWLAAEAQHTVPASVFWEQLQDLAWHHIAFHMVMKAHKKNKGREILNRIFSAESGDEKMDEWRHCFLESFGKDLPAGLLDELEDVDMMRYLGPPPTAPGKQESKTGLAPQEQVAKVVDLYRDLNEEERALLLNVLTDLFTLVELRNLSYLIGVDFKDFPQVPTDFALDLILHSSRRNKLGDLMKAVEGKREEQTQRLNGWKELQAKTMSSVSVPIE